MKTIKTLFTFTMPRSAEVDETTETVNEEGKTVKVTQKVTKSVDKEFALQKPNILLTDDSEFFYQQTMGLAVQAGFMTRSMLAKRLINDGGVLSNDDKTTWANQYKAYTEKETDYQKLMQIDEAARTPEQKKEIEDLLNDMALLRREMNKFENFQESVFNITAESRATFHVIRWWMLFLTHYKNEKDEWLPLYPGETHNDKLLSYDASTDEDVVTDETTRKFNEKVAQKALQAVSLWYSNGIKKQEAFEDIFKGVA